MAFTLGQHKVTALAPAGPVSAAYASNVTAGNLLTCIGVEYAAAMGAPTCTNTGTAGAQTWISLGSFSSSTAGTTINIYYAIASGTGTCTVTVNYANVSFGGEHYLAEWSGTSVAGSTQDGTAQTSQGTAASIVLPSITTARADDLVFGYVSCGSSGTVNSPWTLQDTTAGDVALYRVDLAAGSYTPNVSQASAAYASVLVALGAPGAAASAFMSSKVRARPRVVRASKGRVSFVVPAQVPVPKPALPRQVPAGRRAALLRRGRMVTPVPPQVPVPKPVMGNRISSARSKITTVQRGRVKTPVLTQTVVVLAQVPQRITPKRVLAALARGKRTTVNADQAIPGQVFPHVRGRRRFGAPGRGKRTNTPIEQPVPVRTATKSSRVARAARGKASRWTPLQEMPLRTARSARDKVASLRRGRQVTPLPVQFAAVTPTWTPARTATPRRLLSGAQRGRRVTPTPPQVPVPAPSIPRTVGKWRWAALRKGRQTNPVLTQSAAAPPKYPTPTLGSARRLLSGAQRGRQVSPVPAQQTPTAPAFVPQSARARVKVAMIQRSRRRVDVPHAQTMPPKMGQKSRRLAAWVRRSRFVSNVLVALGLADDRLCLITLADDSPYLVTLADDSPYLTGLSDDQPYAMVLDDDAPYSLELVDDTPTLTALADD